MPFLDTSDVGIYYEFDLTPGLPVVVFLNSLGTDISMWHAQAAALRATYSVLRFDTRGQGRSSVPASGYTMGDAAHDVVALLDHLNITSVAICGLSLGGMICQWLAIHVPERLWAVIICNSAAKIGTRKTWNHRIATVISSGMSSVVPEILERWYTPEFRVVHPDITAHTAAMLLNTDPQGYALACAAIRDMDLRDDIARITTPTLVVYSDQDSVTPPSDALFLLSQIPNAPSLCLSAAHLSNIESPEAFTAGLLHFLGKGATP